MADKDIKNPEQDSLFREIDEEIRQENLAKFWKKYGNVVIAAGVALIVGVGGFKGWQSYELSQRTEAASALLAVDQQAADAPTALARLGESAPGGYALLAKFRAAAVMAENGDASGAAAAYSALAADDAIEPLYRDLADVLGALGEVDSAPPASLQARMARLDHDTNPWRFSAREIIALALLRSGDKAGAQARFDALSQDGAAPQALVQRARAMALHLKD